MTRPFDLHDLQVGDTDWMAHQWGIRLLREFAKGFGVQGVPSLLVWCWCSS
jgi:hypothetical protein